MTTPIRVLTLAAEASPFVKIGGLGDVAGALPSALRSLSTPVDIRLAIPFHNIIDRSQFKLEPIASFAIYHQDGPLIAEIYQTTVDGTPIYLISGPPISDSSTVYSSDAGMDGSKFTFFSLAALALAQNLSWSPHILHAHDWHTAPAIHALAHNQFRDNFYKSIATLITVHNLPYLGVGAGDALTAFGLPPVQDSPLPYWAENLPLPLGLLQADHISTVSKGYAKEILTPEFGAGLDEFLKSRTNSITGILNGLDTKSWDPDSDQSIPFPYSRENLKNRTSNKIALLKELRLDPDPQRPLIGMINRMDHQKGVDLVPNALRALADQNWQAVILGTGDVGLENAIRDLDSESPHVKAIIRYDGELARRIYAGSDTLLIPSRYEPCGLTQMIAMRYGCVPIARSTGGLRDTITDYHPENKKGTRQSTGL